ncbi:MAG: phosphoenolpyruvate-utilizing N-terminal domain-containing protein [Clostridia bacterium]|nr:phosphoenolpyruvate-utilizing N-terminal domain-containing protein [Clostridia bacterium]
MKIYHGIGNKKGTATAKPMLYSKLHGKPEIRTILDAESEKSRFRLAKYIAVKELALLYEKAYAELGESAAMIFYIHQMMLEDDTFTDSVCSIIDNKMYSSEAAVYDTCLKLAGMFDNSGDSYISQRRLDVFDICERVIAILNNESRSFPILTQPSIIVADDLSPSELLLPKREFIAGVVLFSTSENSHTAILANKMDIPMLTSVNINGDAIPENTEIKIDAQEGILII